MSHLLLLLRRRRYSARVKALAPIAYWPLWERSGTTAFDYSGNGRNGAYTGVDLGQPGIGDGRTAPLFDGVNDSVNIYSASLAGAASMTELSMGCWVKVPSSVWSGAANSFVLHIGADSASNYARIFAPTTANTLRCNYVAGGTNINVSKSTFSPTTWFHVLITVSKVNNRVRLYVNGAQEGADATGLGVFAGALNNTVCVIGAQSTTPASPISGTLAHTALWARELTAAEVASLARVA